MAPPRYSKETIKYWNERILAQISNQRGTHRRNAEKKENAVFYFFVAVASVVLNLFIIFCILKFFDLSLQKLPNAGSGGGWKPPFHGYAVTCRLSYAIFFIILTKNLLS